jgi:hypothetical protein
MKKILKEPWFSVRCIFKHPPRADMSRRHLYEERITIWRTDSFEQAIELAERDARKYARDLEYEYLGFAQAYHLSNKQLRVGSEVFSLMRESNLAKNKYLDKYFDTGTERQRNIED